MHFPGRCSIRESVILAASHGVSPDLSGPMRCPPGGIKRDKAGEIKKNDAEN